MAFEPRESDSRVQALSHYLLHTKEKAVFYREGSILGKKWCDWVCVFLQTSPQYVREEKEEEKMDGRKSTWKGTSVLNDSWRWSIGKKDTEEQMKSAATWKVELKGVMTYGLGREGYWSWLPPR